MLCEVTAAFLHDPKSCFWMSRRLDWMLRLRTLIFDDRIYCLLPGKLLFREKGKQYDPDVSLSGHWGVFFSGSPAKYGSSLRSGMRETGHEQKAFRK